MKPSLVIVILIIGHLLLPHSGLGQVKRNASRTSPTPYLFAWTADADAKDSDFLAVIDAKPDSPTYGQVVATLPVGARATYPHHTEYEFPKGSILWMMKSDDADNQWFTR